MIVVVSVHAYNLGVVKYDYKILFVVCRILYLEVKKLFVHKEGSKKKIKVYFLLKSLGNIFAYFEID